jgi:hypothetical protein
VDIFSQVSRGTGATIFILVAVSRVTGTNKAAFAARSCFWRPNHEIEQSEV